MSLWSGGQGLTEITTRDLKKLLSLLHRGEIDDPLTAPELARTGLQHIVGQIDVLRGLDARALRAVLIAVLAERMKAERANLRVVPGDSA